MIKIYSKTIFFIFTFCVLVGCGFHLRGTFDIPNTLQIIKIRPDQPFDPFQRALRKTLVSNGVQVIADEKSNNASAKAATLTLLSQLFSERNVAYGSDGQPNRALLKFNVVYQIKDAQGNLLGSSASVQVERELTLNPTAYLATDNERARLRNDLIVDAASQLVRQLSLTSTP